MNISNSQDENEGNNNDSLDLYNNNGFLNRLFDRGLRERKPPIRYRIDEYVASAMMMSINNFENVPKDFDNIEGQPDEGKWLRAVEEKIGNMKRNKTWLSCDCPDSKVIDSRWVFVIKSNPDGTKRYKARLVARGYQ